MNFGSGPIPLTEVNGNRKVRQSFFAFILRTSAALSARICERLCNVWFVPSRF